MTRFRATAVLAVVLLAAPAFAQTATTSAPAKKTEMAKKAPAPKAATAAVHSTRGVVKSIDATTLVLTRSANKGPETTFVLDASTVREGTIAAGTAVDVRYHMNGSSRVVTAITAHAAAASGAKAHATK